MDCWAHRFLFLSARPRLVSLFDLVGCYPERPPPPLSTSTHINRYPASSRCRRQQHQHESMHRALEETNSHMIRRRSGGEASRLQPHSFILTGGGCCVCSQLCVLVCTGLYLQVGACERSFRVWRGAAATLRGHVSVAETICVRDVNSARLRKASSLNLLGSIPARRLNVDRVLLKAGKLIILGGG